MRQRVSRRAKDEEMFDNLLSGTTATLVIQTPKKLYLGWIGDSMAHIWRNVSEKQSGQFATNVMHKPDLKSEAYRIYDKRGEVRQTNDNEQRVFLRSRMYPGLKVTRTIGDLISHQIGVISEPQTRVIKINPMNDKIFILGTDGLWDFISPGDMTTLINDMNIGQREYFG